MSKIIIENGEKLQMLAVMELDRFGTQNRSQVTCSIRKRRHFKFTVDGLCHRTSLFSLLFPPTPTKSLCNTHKILENRGIHA